MKLITIGALVAAVAACRDPHPTFKETDPLTVALVERSCGATDGPAVSIFLAPGEIRDDTPDPPYVRIWIQESVLALGGTSWSVPDSAAAWYYRSGPEPEDANAGRVNITSVKADTSVTGTVTLDFKDRQVVQAFNAKWRPRNFLCGA